MTSWPSTAEDLRAEQKRLAMAPAPAWSIPDAALAIGGCFVCFPRGIEGPGAAGDPGWAGAAVIRDGRLAASGLATGNAGAPYAPGLLALREGPLLSGAVEALPQVPDVLLVDATGRDHPRRAGLALHLGAALDLPTVGVTHRLLLAAGEWPESVAGATSPIRIGEDVVAHWLRTRTGARPLAVHAAWRTSPEQAVDIVRRALGRARTPEALRQARRLARTARAGAQRV